MAAIQKGQQQYSLHFEPAESEPEPQIVEETDSIALKRKSDVELRMQYLSKLTYHQVWLPPSKQKKSH